MATTVDPESSPSPHHVRWPTNASPNQRFQHAASLTSVAGTPKDEETPQPQASPSPPDQFGVPGSPGATFRRRWVVLFLALYPLVAVWSLTNPMFASPDETVHMARAQSFARGDFSAPFTTDGLPIESVECFRFQPDVTAACQDLTWGADGTLRETRTEGYPPLFHGLASIPSLIFSDLAGAYIMRLWMAALVVAAFAWAGTLMTRLGLGPFALAGFVLAITPTATFVSSTVNPSGLAMAAALLFVSGILSSHFRRTPERAAPIAIAIGAGGLALSRRDGLLWLAVLCLILVPFWWAGVARFVRRQRGVSVLIASVVALTTALVSVVWASPTVSRFARSWNDGRGTTVWEGLKSIRVYIYEMFGVFGWKDTIIGDEALLFGAALYGFVVLVALIGTCRRLVVSSFAALAALLLSPVVIGLFTFPYVQGRYLFPVLAALMLLAGTSASFGDTGAKFESRATLVVISGWAVIQLVAGLQNLRRYAVGRFGPWDFVFDAEWHPDTMPNAAAVVALCVALAISITALVMVHREVSRDAGRDAPTSGDVSVT